MKKQSRFLVSSFFWIKKDRFFVPRFGKFLVRNHKRRRLKEGNRFLFGQFCNFYGKHRFSRDMLPCFS